MNVCTLWNRCSAPPVSVDVWPWVSGGVVMMTSIDERCLDLKVSSVLRRGIKCSRAVSSIHEFMKASWKRQPGLEVTRTAKESEVKANFRDLLGHYEDTARY